MRAKSVGIQEWQQFVEGLPDYSFAQLPAFAQAYSEAYPNCKIATKKFSFDDGVEVLVPLIEIAAQFGFRAYASLPRGFYGGFLWKKRPNQEQMKLILNCLLNKRTVGIAIYPNPFQWKDLRFLENHGFKGKETFTHILELGTDYEWVWKNRLDGKNRNQTRKALKSGVTVTTASDISQIRTYYDLYVESAHRWDLRQRLMMPLRFFETLFQLCGDRVKYYFAMYSGICIASVVIYCERRGCVYGGGAMLKEYGRYCPNNLLLNRVIEDACKKGYRYLDMGGSPGLPGVQRFKESFGAKKIDYKCFLYENPLLRIYRKLLSL
jgi:hypothetical protein